VTAEDSCCYRAFPASGKIWDRAAVDGTLYAAAPAGPMIALTAAPNGECGSATARGETCAPWTDLGRGF
jgi:hypothetical protein